MTHRETLLLKEIAARRSAGSQLSNVIYNTAQKHTDLQRYLSIVREWDAIPRNSVPK